MEKIITIQKALPTTERAYTDKNGQPQVFTSRGFVLSDGIDTFYAEMQGDLARVNAHTAYDTGTTYSVQLQLSLRTYTDSQGTERYVNEARIMKMG